MVFLAKILRFFRTIKNYLYSLIYLSILTKKGKNCRIGRYVKLFNPDYIKFKTMTDFNSFKLIR